jgi:hypothetical protein
MWVFLSLCTLLPFWWRFCQCLNKYYETGLKVHLINSVKYLLKMIPPLVLFFDIHSGKTGDENFWVFATFNVIATLYCTGWDYYMDWGLIRCFKMDKFLLRKMLTFRPATYYFAALTNFVLRFAWLVGIYTFPHDEL